jgi:hypothetical protein
MLKRISHLWHSRPRPFNALWHWASGHGPERWRALVQWTGKRAKAARDRHTWKRSRWWVAKRTIYHGRLKRARKHAQDGKQPKYEKWMANGCDDRVVQGVKDYVARAVVLYDCVCTSLARTFVPPGGSTTSYHLLSINNPAKAGDIAGPRMAQFQHDEFKRDVGKSNCLELFGPINDEWVKNGQRTGGGEGTPLEQLHDTHCHGAFAQ